MKICEQINCGNWSNKFKNKCDVMTIVPNKCDSYMNKESKEKLELDIAEKDKNQTSRWHHHG